jgi:ribonuclease P protein component
VGIVVPKHGKDAVERNRLKRRLRELVRGELLARLGATDVLIRARPEAYRATFGALREDVHAIARRVEAPASPR